MNWQVGVRRAFRLLLHVSVGVVLSLLVFIGTTLAFLIFVPVLSFSHEQTQKILSWLLPDRLAFEARDAGLRIERGSDGLLSKRIRFSAKNLCLSSKEVSGCLKEGSIGFTLSWRNLRSLEWRPEIIEIEPIRVSGLNGQIDFPAPSQEKPESADKGLFNYLSTEVIPKWRYIGTRVEVEKFEVKREGDEEVVLSALLETQANGEASLALRNLFVKQSNLRATGQLNLVPRKEGYEFKALAEIFLPRKRIVHLNGNAFVRDFQTADFNLRSHWRGFAGLREIRIAGTRRDSRLKSRLSLRSNEIKPWFRSLVLDQCEIGVNLRANSGVVRCAPGAAQVHLVEREFIRRGEQLVLAPEIELTLSRIDLNMPRADWTLQLRFDGKNILKGEVDAEGSVARASKGNLDLNFRAKLNASIERFQRLVRYTHLTRYAVPAPLNVFDGPVGSEAWVNWTNRDVEMRFQAETKLTSRHQRARIKLNGETRIDRFAKKEIPLVLVNVEILDLALAAPRLEIPNIPKLTPDSRFGPIPSRMIAPSPKEEPLKKAHFQVRVKTTRPDSIRINTNLTADPLPIGLDLAYSDFPKRKTSTTGWITVGTTGVEIFRRRGTLEELRFDLLESGVQKVLARVTTSVHDYDISIFLSGDVTKPDVLLDSEPPLPRDQILSVLLFGRPLEELEAFERSSVTDVEAAIANAALGVASLYYFAKTPIESISYDPSRRLLTAQVGIGGGASVEFGRGGQGTVVGFEKRLSRDFVFRSDVERLAASGSQTVSALIEWVKRF